MIRIGLCGQLGYSFACRLWQLHKQELENRFSHRFLSIFRDQGSGAYPFSPVQETGFRMYEIGEGGLFGTLWQLCDEEEQKTGRVFSGCEVDLYRIPVRQEVVEICELYEENPYEIPSPGCFLVLWDEEREPGLTPECLSILQKSAMIGKLTMDHNRIVTMNGHERFLTPPARQRKDILDRTGKKEVSELLC